MYDLLSRTISQGLQAFLPVAFALTWFRRAGDADAAAGVRRGLAAAVPVTFAAMFAFQRSTRQSLVEAILAAATLAVAIWFAQRVQRAGSAAPAVSPGLLACAIGAILIVVRQTMEIAVAFVAVLQLRALEPLGALVGGVAVSIAAAAAWIGVGSRVRLGALTSATRVFAVLFALQVAFYLFHESAEAGLLPWSGVLHAATEPYGPDGVYGRYVSALLFAIPFAAAAARSRGPRQDEARRGGRALTPGLAIAVALVLVAAAELVTVVGRERDGRISRRSVAMAAELSAITAVPHVLFRHMAADPNYGLLSVAPLSEIASAPRAAVSLLCDRISYAAGRGVCLSAERGLFTNYKVVFFDAALNAARAVKLEGSPSRTRVSPDGRVGAFTVFALGSAHTYEGSSFSTRTVILDMATGGELGDLAQFTTWRDGKRIKAADFNVWGVTFTRDSNLFYATLATAGKTYLVRGDLGLRTLTVVRENVECPALSPDNRLIAFKKRVGPAGDPWRFHVLDLATMTDRPIAAETRSIDDQLEWLDDTHVLYGAPRTGQPSSHDVWVAPVDGTGPARVFLSDAESPIVVR